MPISNMQKITANIRGNYRKEVLLGRTYLVAPVTMIVPGVLEGSDGKKLYTANETAKSEILWNGMPLVLEHPKENGKYISARRPDVLSACSLGYVYNVNMTDAGLEGEAWFDYKITKQREPKIIANIKAGKNMELSTGVFTDDVPAPSGSKFNNVSYDLIATNQRPDHLAILMTKEGACSLKDGCGVHVNEKGETLSGNELSHDQIRTALREVLGSKFTQNEPYFYICDVFDDYFVYDQANKMYQLGYNKTETGVTLLDETPVEVVREVSFSPVTNEKEQDMAGKKGLIDDLVTNGCGCWTEEDRPVLEKMTEDRLTDLVANSKETKQLKLVANEAKKGITVGKNIAKFDAKKGKFVVNQLDPEEEDEDGDEEEKEEASTRTPKKKVTSNTSKEKDKSEMTLNEWLEDPTVPNAVKSAFRTAGKFEKQEIKRLATALTANIRDEDLREEKKTKLLKKDLETLQEMAEFLPTNNSQENEEDNEPSFFGSLLTSNTRRQQESDPEDVLETPTVDWASSARS